MKFLILPTQKQKPATVCDVYRPLHPQREQEVDAGTQSNCWADPGTRGLNVEACVVCKSYLYINQRGE